MNKGWRLVAVHWVYAIIGDSQTIWAEAHLGRQIDVTNCRRTQSARFSHPAWNRLDSDGCIQHVAPFNWSSSLHLALGVHASKFGRPKTV